MRNEFENILSIFFISVLYLSPYSTDGNPTIEPGKGKPALTEASDARSISSVYISQGSYIALPTLFYAFCKNTFHAFPNLSCQLKLRYVLYALSQLYSFQALDFQCT